MFRHRLDQHIDVKTVLHWMLLSVSAGSVNASGFVMTGRFVTHVTGFATLFGTDLASGESLAAFRVLTVPLFFLLGAMTSGLLIDRQIHHKKPPHFDWVMATSAIFLLTAAVIGMTKSILPLGTMPEVQDSYLVLALMCASSGLQNAAFTSSSGATIRTTHMTGLTTDIGLGVARLATFSPHTSEFRREARNVLLRAGTVSSFVVGSLVGAFFALRMQSLGLLMPASISAYAAWHGRRQKVAMHRITDMT